MSFLDPYGILAEQAQVPPEKFNDWLASFDAEKESRFKITYRDNCRRDVLFLAREVLGYDWIEYDLQYHQELAKQAMWVGDSLTLCPRSFIKSTVVTIAGTIWYLLNHKNHCVLIVSNNKENAKKFLKGIADHFTGNQLFRYLFADYAPQDFKEDPTKEQLTIPSRSNKGRREASIEIAGIDTSLAGRHYEKIVEDDIVHEINVPPKGSIEIMQTVFLQHQNLDHLLKTGVQDDVIPHRATVGTRWHDGDAYGRMLHPDEEMYDLIEALIAEPYGNMWRNQDNRTGLVWNNGGQIRSDEEGVLWESRYPPGYLSVLKRKRGSYGWACLMAQDPLPPDSATNFKSEWFHRFEMEYYDEHPNEFQTAMTIDGAFTEDAGKKSDRTAIGVSAIHHTGAPYLLAIKAGKYRPSQICDAAINLWREWPQCEYIGVECDAGGRAIYNDLRDAVEELGLDIWVKELWTHGLKKDARVARLLSRAERRGIYYHDGISQEYIQEILRYGVAMHRDIPDMLAYRVLDTDIPEEPVVPKAPEQLEYVGMVHTGADIINALENPVTPFNPWSM